MSPQTSTLKSSPAGSVEAERLEWLPLAGEAEALAREALAGMRSALGDAHPLTLGMRRCLLNLLTAQGKHPEARVLRASFSRAK